MKDNIIPRHQLAASQSILNIRFTGVMPAKFPFIHHLCIWSVVHPRKWRKFLGNKLLSISSTECIAELPTKISVEPISGMRNSQCILGR